jgi:hypothetical protein
MVYVKEKDLNLDGINYETATQSQSTDRERLILKKAIRYMSLE